MKRLFTICLLAGALLMAGMAAEAKTTKKTTKTSQNRKGASSSFTAKNFMRSIARGYELKSLNQIKSILTSNGYKFVGSEYTQIYELDTDCYIYRDSKGNEVVVSAINDSSVGAVNDVKEITFTFVNSTERDKFLKGTDRDAYGAHDNVIITKNGNTVILEDDCYYC